MSEGDVMLDVAGITVEFGGVRAVNDVSFHVSEGEVFGIVGPNGAGKTTLLNCVSGLIRPGTGAVRFRGRRIEGQRPHRIAAMGLARTFQNAHFFKDLTAERYLMLGMLHHGPSLAFAAAIGTRGTRRREREQAAVARRTLALFGIEASADVRLRELPYGVQRVVDVARAMASSPSLILMDEPTSGTVSGERERLVGIVSYLKSSGVTVIIVDHDVNFVRRCCQRMLVLDYGQALAVGAPAEVFERADVKAAYIGISQKAHAT